MHILMELTCLVRAKEYSAYPWFILFLSNRVQTMGDAIDLTGDGGVIKTIVRKSKSDAVAPTEDFPLVDGNAFSQYFRVIIAMNYIIW